MLFFKYAFRVSVYVCLPKAVVSIFSESVQITTGHRLRVGCDFFRWVCDQVGVADVSGGCVCFIFSK